MSRKAKTAQSGRPALWRDKRGNVFMIFAFSLVPIMLAVGTGIDYSRAMTLKTRLDAIADAAALTAVSPGLMTKDTDAAQAAAINLFNAQAAFIKDKVYDPASGIQIDVTDTANGTSTVRSATVKYVAQSTNLFGAFFNIETLPVNNNTGIESSSGSAANMDVYVLMDTSPSMGIPSTLEGIKAMKTATGGCAFACHEYGPNNIVADDGLGNKIPFNLKLNGKMVDFYTYATQNPQPITLRVDEQRTAVSALINTITNAGATSKSVYRVSVTSFDNNIDNFQPLTSDLASAASRAATVPKIYLARNPKDRRDVYDQNTHFAEALLSFNNGDSSNYIKNPGSGAKNAEPLKYLFIVTDGFDDASRYAQFGPINTNYCKNLKGRGITIGILYTKYFIDSLKGNYDSFIPLEQTPLSKTYLTAAATTTAGVSETGLSPTEYALKSCASTGLFYTVNTGEDIQSALSALFNQAVAQPKLVK